jgi:galactokinase
MSSSTIDRAAQAFKARFGTAPALVVQAPGRVNLIGEHTDYNDGFVLPMAIDRSVVIALRPRDPYVVAHALDYDGSAQFDPSELVRASLGDVLWAEYVRGVAWALGQAGYRLAGWEGVITGDVPQGAGLSSSAAIELATARAFCAVSGFDWDPKEMALLCQRAENEWIGVRTGIMDQMISASGVADHAVLIDCRSLETSPVPLPIGTVAVILDTATRRELVTSAYNERRQQCEIAAGHFGVKALRDVTFEQLLGAQDALDPLVFRRARHVVTENARTLAAADAMRADDAMEMGRLMDESHVSMRDDFEITNQALNTMVEIARAQPGCFGARMTGGGFGGCAVALVAAEQAEAFAATAAEAYTRSTHLTPAVYITPGMAGARVVVDAR